MNDLVTNENAQTQEMRTIEAPQGIAPLVQLIASGAVDTQQIEKMMELQERWDKNEARKAYYESIALARADMPMIIKNRSNSHLHTSYADLDGMIAGAGPVLGKNNLSFNFEYDQSVAKQVTTSCITTHALGHTERVTVVMPVMEPIRSKSGNMATNPAQMVGIAMTYGRRYAFAAAFGIATGDDNDANIPQPEVVSEPMLEESDMIDLKAVCEEHGKDYDKFLSYMSTKRPLFNGILQAPKADKAPMIASIKKSAAKTEETSTEGEKE